MKRLTELPGDDRLTARAQALVEAMGRTPESEERLLRVRRSLDAPVGAAAPRWVWRGALAFGLVGVSAVAAASGRAWWGTPSVQPAAADSPAKVALPVVPKPGPSPAVAPMPERLPTAPSVGSASSGASPLPHNAGPHVAAPPLSDVARVHEAAKALRHDADPERALQLLERPGARISGPLAEEALALRIEASMARGDGRQAKLAAAYLTQYPNGRYKELATKALAGRK